MKNNQIPKRIPLPIPPPPTPIQKVSLPSNPV